jgi:hypothetical protein
MGEGLEAMASNDDEFLTLRLTRHTADLVTTIACSVSISEVLPPLRTKYGS